MVTSIIGEDATNQNGHLASLSETEIALDKQSRVWFCGRAWQYLCRKRDDVNDHLVAAKGIVSLPMRVQR